MKFVIIPACRLARLVRLALALSFHGAAALGSFPPPPLLNHLLVRWMEEEEEDCKERGRKVERSAGMS